MFEEIFARIQRTSGSSS